MTPLMLYPAAPNGTNGCAPLAVISHGAGGSENGYRYLAQAVAALGYTTVVMGHRESGFDALAGDVAKSTSLHAGTRALVEDPAAEGDRLLDVGAALAWAEKTCHAPFRVLLGHSMGAETTMLEAGAKPLIAIDPKLAGRSRFDAYVALSPEGPGMVFQQHAWRGITKPVLIMTGTLDGALNGMAASRQIPWTDLPGSASHCQWMGVVDRGTHMNFAGNGPGHLRVEPMVTQTVAAFLAGVRSGGCETPVPIAGMTLQVK